MQTQDAEDPSQTLEEDEPTRTLRNENGVADIPLTTIARNTGVPYNLPGSDFWEELFHTGEHQFDDDTSSAMITPAPEISGQTTLAALSESTTPGQVLSKDDFAGPGRIEGATFASPGDFSSLRSRASPLASAGSTQEVVTIRLPPVTSYVGPPKKSAPANWWDGAEEVGWTTGQNCATTTVVRPTPAVYMSCVPWMYPPTTNESQASSVISLEFRRLVVDWVVFFARIGCFGLAIWFCFTQEWMYLATSVIYYVFLSIPVLDNAIKLGFCFLSFLVLQIIVGVYGTILIYYDYNY